jgi:predicted NBD/HSP70 family sugar kinase
MSEINIVIKNYQEEGQSTNNVVYKNINLQKQILDYILKNHKSTISELAKETKTSIPKVNEVLIELLKKEIIKDLGKEIIGVGRKPNFYGINPDVAYFIIVEVRRHSITLSIVNFNNLIVDIKPSIPFKLANTEESFNELCEIIDNYIADQTIDPNKITGIGMSITGRVNQKTGNSYSYFNLSKKSLKENIEERFKMPSYVENDTRAMAIGEFYKGCVEKEKDILFFNLDEGIGMGIIMDGKIYSGKSGFSGEFGHIPFFENDIICHCGKKGCLETEVSGLALIEILKEQIGKGISSSLSEAVQNNSLISIEMLVDAALKGDMLSIEIISLAGEKIGKGIAMLLNLFNPELVILGGELSKSQSLILLPILSSINKYSLNLINTDTNFKYSKLGKNSGVLGVSILLRNQLLGI